ncbi:hypothetical protein [Phenylobacterium sp.]|uniref:hypothetical protein n=1 Tax=Phenylobacterium sp. TaxID=1871053 RepID=UPI00273301B8|nr:hypothetical protein [Phenylobacterium sp.]MDP3660975.1 hypothetical protein [Phenylobacterium sp.]
MGRIVLGVAACAMMGLTACDQAGQGKQSGPAPYNNGANGWPGAQGNGQPPMAQNQGPQGYPQQGAYPQLPQGYPLQQGPYPPQGPQDFSAQQPQNQQANAGYNQQPPYPPQGPQGYPQGPAPQGPAPQGPGGLRVAGPPPGMEAMPTPAGHVFTTQLNGSPQASKLVQAVLQGTQSYFDGPSRILNTQTDPSERMSRVDFSNTLHGQPVMGMIGVMGDGRNAGVAYLLFDSADRVQQTMPMMMAATQRRPGG